MTQPWLPPNIKPLNRLQVSNGLLIDSERWQLAHEYHRKRQNAHFQSLNQPGIVSDLGVRLIKPPADVPAKYRDKRWVQIQSGIAIDLFGNLIVVPEPIDFRITSEAIADKPLIVYLVVSYVDPEALVRKETNGNGDIVTETFRIDEKNSLPNDWEVELCRILLEPGKEELSAPKNVFFPVYNELDLRYRPQARSRPQAIVRIAQVIQNRPDDAKNLANLSYLLQSIASLYPALHGSEEVAQVTLKTESEIAELFKYDLLYLKSQRSESLSQQELSILERYIEMGGVLLVEAAIAGTKVEELIALQQQLETAIARLDATTTISEEDSSEENEELANLAEIKASLDVELREVKHSLKDKINELCPSFKNFAQQIGTPLEDFEYLNRNHPLRTQPFLFAALPTVNGQSIKLLIGGGIIILIGSLSSAWGLDEKLSLPRETIRTAQEMGINIINYARKRRQMTQAIQPPNLADISTLS